MNRIERLLTMFVVALAVFVVNEKIVEATPSERDSLAAVNPVLATNNCKNISMTSLTPTLVASGTALHEHASYDIVATGAACWCVTTSTQSAATGTGRHFPQNAIVVGRFGPNKYMACSCDGTAQMNLCRNEPG